MGKPPGVVGVQTGIEDLVHPVDHDPLEKAGYLLGLLFGTLQDQRVVAGDHELRVEVLGEPLAEEGHGELEPVGPGALHGAVKPLE